MNNKPLKLCNGQFKFNVKFKRFEEKIMRFARENNFEMKDTEKT